MGQRGGEDMAWGRRRAKLRKDSKECECPQVASEVVYPSTSLNDYPKSVPNNHPLLSSTIAPVVTWSVSYRVATFLLTVPHLWFYDCRCPLPSLIQMVTRYSTLGGIFFYDYYKRLPENERINHIPGNNKRMWLLLSSSIEEATKKSSKNIRNKTATAGRGLIILFQYTNRMEHPRWKSFPSVVFE